MKELKRLAVVLICGVALQASPEPAKPKFEAFYVPFGVDTYFETTLTNIETRHNITSLIEGKLNRFQRVLASGDKTDKFYSYAVRLKLNVGGEITLVDQAPRWNEDCSHSRRKGGTLFAFCRIYSNSLVSSLSE